MSARGIATAVGLLVLVAAGARAQGLGQAAARERAKRADKTEAKKGQPAPAFTNEDLERGRPPGTKSGTASPAAAASPATESVTETQAEGEASSSEAGDDRRQQERGYLDEITAAQAEVRAAEGRIRELSDKLNPMSLSYIYGSGGSNDANEELRVRSELREAEAQLISARQAVLTANQNLRDFRAGRARSSEQPR